MLLKPALAAGPLLALVIAAPPPAGAHALVLESFPRAGEVVTAPPAQLSLRFNSRIEKALSGVTVTGPAGRPVPLPVSTANPAPNHLVAPLPPLGPGQYLVRWKVLSADGHVTEGAFRFTLAPGY